MKTVLRISRKRILSTPRFSGVFTVSTVSDTRLQPFLIVAAGNNTLLKQGVNENRCPDLGQISEAPKANAVQFAIPNRQISICHGFATLLSLGLCLLGSSASAATDDSVALDSPGFKPSRLNGQGQLVEDWGTMGLKLSGDGIIDGQVKVEAVKLDGLIPAAQAVSPRGAVALTWTAYRAPAHPAGLDVLTVRIAAAPNRAATNIVLGLEVPKEARIGLRMVRVKNRTVLTLPREFITDEQWREWGSADESTALAGWAKPKIACDAAFRNIRAGIGGVPIIYRFTVKPKSEANVVLGFCESHWAEAGQRLLSCRVEGAPAQEVDPFAKWGQHKPGALLFKARDENGDGKLEVSVRPASGAGDKNPILNVIWLFPPGEAPKLDKVIAGELTTTALRYVDVGGENDQTIYPPGKLEYRLSLPVGGVQEFTFLVACEGGEAPLLEVSGWTAETLRRATREVWRDWKPLKETTKP
jgi:hypothetical protein